MDELLKFYSRKLEIKKRLIDEYIEEKNKLKWIIDKVGNIIPLNIQTKIN